MKQIWRILKRILKWWRLLYYYYLYNSFVYLTYLTRFPQHYSNSMPETFIIFLQSVGQVLSSPDVNKNLRQKITMAKRTCLAVWGDCSTPWSPAAQHKSSGGRPCGAGGRLYAHLFPITAILMFLPVACACVAGIVYCWALTLFNIALASSACVGWRPLINLGWKPQPN